MAGLWSKKFDRTNGETRQCKQCGDTYYTMKPRWVCRKCVNAKQKIFEEAKRAKYKSKIKYPYHSDNRGWQGSAKQHFLNIRSRNSKAWKGGREALTDFYSKIFEEIQANGIMEWICDRRDKETLDKDRKKRDSKIRSDFPDTRGYYE